jgi:nucleotide-binding universal stress UspA family protein
MIAITRLLSPTDFSDASKHALAYAVELARRYNAELHLLHVVESVMYPAEVYGQVGLVDVEGALEQGAREELAHWKATLVPRDVACTTAIAHGRSHVEINAYAAAKSVDLIVIATQGRGVLDHLLLGSVAEKVVRHAPCSVLTVHAAQRDMLR